MTATAPYERDFTKAYLELRTLEGRVYSDEELRQLPLTARGNGLRKEWKLRAHSAQRLIRYLRSRPTPPTILEVGCGNGWLSQLLASIDGAIVTGTDINYIELQQAARVFHHRTNLTFICGDIRLGLVENLRFDIIVFAASIQYFPSFPEIILPSLRLLKPHGEIHIVDTPFYSTGERDAARGRTRSYFERLGHGAMSDRYYHRGVDELQPFPHTYLYRPGRLFSLGRSNPFPWIRIAKDDMQ